MREIGVHAGMKIAIGMGIAGDGITTARSRQACRSHSGTIIANDKWNLKHPMALQEV